MIDYEKYAWEEWRVRIAEQAKKAFAEHRIAKETENRWKCYKPGTSHYLFRVQFGPDSIHLYGDLEDLVLHPHGGDPKDWLISVMHPDRNDPLINNSLYIMEKAPLVFKEFQQVFLIKEALGQITSDREEALEEEDEERLRMVEELEANFTEQSPFTDDRRGECGTSVAWCEAFYEAYNSAEGMDTPYDWGSQVLIQLHALRTFVKLYLEKKHEDDSVS